MDWFTVDKAGLAKLLARKGKAFAIYELVQNAWDTSATEVRVTLEPVEGRPLVKVTVEDDAPEGFSNLAHAFTLFAESDKKADVGKRGRFNLGEKLVLALCEEARIESTTGTVVFNADGRQASRRKRDAGSVFTGVMKMTREELGEVTAAVGRLIPPFACRTIFNGEPLPPSASIEQCEATLATEIADEEGYLRRSAHRTRVSVHQLRDGETPTLYEMGIPVVELGGDEPWHINVHQKVPLNMDRDNVTAGYLQTLRVVLANHMRDRLTKEDAEDAGWIENVVGDRRLLPETVDTILSLRFGKKRAIFDRSDPEANKALMNEGYTVIPGGALSKDQWARVREHGLALPSGKIKPSHHEYGDGPAERVVDPADYTEGQRAKVAYAEQLAEVLLTGPLHVRIVSEITRAAYAWFVADSNELTLNLGRLGKAWFECPLGQKHHELLLHEFAHARVADHLTREFSDEVGRLFARLVDLALVNPGLFQRHGYSAV